MWNASKFERFEAVEPHMGTLVGITLYAPSLAVAREGFQAAYARIAELNARLSDYRDDSELSRLSTAPQMVSSDLWRVLAFAAKLSAASNGAFDVTVGPLTRRWRARQSFDPKLLPLVNWREVHMRNGQVWLGKAGMQLDLGAVGKGFAGDEALAALHKLGLTRALIAASGDIVCGDAPPGTKGWSVQASGRTLSLKHAAVSSSGDTEQFFVKDGQRFSHILDPRTGLSFSDVVEISVVAKHGLTADGLATACRVVGSAGAQKLCKQFHAHPLPRTIVAARARLW